MPDQKISELAAITTIDNAADVLPIVDTSATTTKKVTPTQLKTSLALNNVDNTSDANKPISSATQTALDAKQATLVSGTNIKTVNNTSLLGSGNIAISSAVAWGGVTGTLSNQTDLQTALDGKVDENSAITGATKTKITYDAKGLVTAGADATTADIADSTNKRYVTDANLTVIQNTSGTNTGDNAVNSLYSGLATSKQDTLVSGTNIKTVNSTSLLGSGDVAVQATLVSGTNIKTINSTSLLGSGDITISASPSGVSGAIQFSNGSAFASDAANLFWDDTNNRLGVGTNAPSATAHFKGSGSTSATTSLLVQNSAGASSLQVTDDGSVFNYGKGALTTNTAFGVSAIGGNNTAGNLSAFGRGALQTNTSGSSNSAFGRNALSANSSGSSNSAFGVGCLTANTSGSNNSSLGVDTSSGNFSGSVILGNEATATANNQFVVGSVGTNAGAVNSTTDVPATFLWSVRINGTNYKILMTT